MQSLLVLADKWQSDGLKVGETIAVLYPDLQKIVSGYPEVEEFIEGDALFLLGVHPDRNPHAAVLWYVIHKNCPKKTKWAPFWKKFDMPFETAPWRLAWGQRSDEELKFMNYKVYIYRDNLGGKPVTYYRSYSDSGVNLLRDDP